MVKVRRGRRAGNVNRTRMGNREKTTGRTGKRRQKMSR